MVSLGTGTLRESAPCCWLKRGAIAATLGMSLYFAWYNRTVAAPLLWPTSATTCKPLLLTKSIAARTSSTCVQSSHYVDQRAPHGPASTDFLRLRPVIYSEAMHVNSRMYPSNSKSESCQYEHAPIVRNKSMLSAQSNNHNSKEQAIKISQSAVGSQTYYGITRECYFYLGHHEPRAQASRTQHCCLALVTSSLFLAND